MNAERDPRRGQVRLPAFAESGRCRMAGSGSRRPGPGRPVGAGPQSGDPPGPEDVELDGCRAYRRYRRRPRWRWLTTPFPVGGPGGRCVVQLHRGRRHGRNAGGKRAAGLSLGGDDQRVRRDDDHHLPRS